MRGAGGKESQSGTDSHTSTIVREHSAAAIGSVSSLLSSLANAEPPTTAATAVSHARSAADTASAASENPLPPSQRSACLADAELVIARCRARVLSASLSRVHSAATAKGAYQDWSTEQPANGSHSSG